ncbi:hypothetical protein A3D05_05165 [Candidatus Gottesmanbacteria bacterium RIFCSPHIGHO2_02_FULL_40_24]|uniref:Methylated-DNA-[protein]-cysteine S-methyltransferase DNA binding domain-containing protein n=1 Tax=Candidatus Gottesmanbacteria bacterium RIFCSPHIGHO2_01_FULL_40_15 TaxID=1798376 RepID=A0A1F5Z6M8_9BACT|nr:MAG: hypothetical protein A2777_01800 [Candidatus Gottesmanbacteria bacterium RIFCSPHIGHO2_01_FULL_40_15]OGG16421.1 MAG: hypothetical protein A3D05_05165 [Candidatus Gottesmanbacteria bacterium RIFCSPHIGHO2_02_FULL_40_24]OGG22703.1 MAG: hypothetical protein A3B48_02795 [Candidatus Gottesmanbacteria bacterium RIFCSPLOWO2_01_FULL_40_10]OGG25535.1 MAG: hypothetical protein A3E42_04315 [Candidatus Gottesmanbacteria bacterium RIFCSPHIGHO2_12_FULL_40_13]OGG32544.1 MAG: hypothetical protein A3I80_0
MTQEEKVFRFVSAIPAGKVTTYKNLAGVCGIKNPRLVGRILHKNTDPLNIPCHRVVRADGSLSAGYAYGGKRGQKKRLIAEGIIINNHKIDLNKFCFYFPRSG